MPLMRRLAAALLAACFVAVAPGTVRAQGDAPAPLKSLLKGALAKSGGKAAAASASADATRFKPSGTRLTLDAYVKAATEDGAEQKILRETFGTMLAEYEKAAKAAGHPDDVALAVTYAVAQYWSIWKGVEVPDAAQEALFAQMSGALLAAPELAAMADADKQRLYEATLLSAFTLQFSHAVAVEGKDAAMKKGAARAAHDALTSLLGVAPETVRLTAKGLEPAAGTPAPPPAPAGASAVASYTVPGGWEKKAYDDGTTTHRAVVQDGDRRHDCEIRILPARSAPKGAADAFQQVWRESLADFEAAPVSVAFRAVFPCKAVCHYMGDFYKLKGKDQRMYVGVYVLDLGGGRVQPIVTSVLPGRAQFDFDPTGPALTTLSAAVDPFFESLRLKTALPPVPANLFARADLVGYWSESSSAMVLGGYYTTAGGQYAGEMMSASGLILYLNPDGTFYYRFAYSNRGGRDVGQDVNEGKFRFGQGGDLLNLDPKFARTYRYQYKVVGSGLQQTDKGTKRVLVLRGPDSVGKFLPLPFVPRGRSLLGSVDWLIQSEKQPQPRPSR